jgi:hypothetical protein
LGFALLTFKSLDCDFFGSFGLSSTVAVVGKAATLPRRVRAHGVLDLLALTDLPPAMKPNCGSGIVAFRLIESPSQSSISRIDIQQCNRKYILKLRIGRIAVISTVVTLMSHKVYRNMS